MSKSDGQTGFCGEEDDKQSTDYIIESLVANLEKIWMEKVGNNPDVVKEGVLTIKIPYFLSSKNDVKDIIFNKEAILYVDVENTLPTDLTTRVKNEIKRNSAACEILYKGNPNLYMKTKFDAVWNPRTQRNNTY